MPEFNTAIDIANRACDHVGVSLISSSLGFTEDTKQARRIGSVYGKLRRAELRRNVWRFAIRHAALRPIDTDTMILAPVLWVESSTYFVGSIVVDDQGNYWISRIPNNLGYQPQNTPAWEPYFGPLTVTPYSSTTTYFAGELVYTADGDGTNRVYLSLQSNNQDDPATATDWDSTTTYSKNQTITVDAGNDAYTKVLLHCDGTDGATTFTDSNTGGSSHTWTAHNSAQIDTAQYKFGGASGLFARSTNDYIDTPDHADFTLGSSDFTIDGFFKCSFAAGNQAVIIGQCDNAGSAASTSFYVRRGTGGTIEASVSHSVSSTTITGTTQFTDAVNTGWHHFAFVRTGNILKLFIDGTQEGGDVSFSDSVNDSSNKLTVGRIGELNSQWWEGWLDELRMSVGVARWTHDFSPPAREYDTTISFQSLIDLNTGNDPMAAPALWDAGTTYSIGDEVGGSDGYIYTSLTNSNVGNDPTTSGSNWDNTLVLNPWTTVFVGGTGSLKWLQIGGAEFPNGVTLTTPNIVYPIGTGPASQDTTRNIFRLPAGYLRKAPQDPKVGSTSWFGAPTNRLYDDWLFEAEYIVTSLFDVIVLRFVADVTDVRLMDDMFCEGLGARIGLAVCEPLTQSGAKLNTIAQEYARFMGEARTVNAIETGSEEPALDDYLAARY